MAKLETFFSILGHYKYLITIIIGVLFVGVFSENSVVSLVKLDMQKNDLQQEVERYRKLTQEAEIELAALKGHSNTVEKVARERYFMKRADEDVFVLSTDLPTVDEKKPNDAAK